MSKGAQKRITVEQLRAQKKPLQRTVLWHGIAVSVKTLLPMKEVLDMVESVMDSCYDKTHGIIVPEMKDFAFRVNVVSRYACVDLPDDINEQYELLYNTDIYDTIIEAVNQAQVRAAEEAVGKLIPDAMTTGYGSE